MGGAVDPELRAEALAAYLDAWEAEHGAFTPAEFASAERELRLPGSSGV